MSDREKAAWTLFAVACCGLLMVAYLLITTKPTVVEKRVEIPVEKRIAVPNSPIQGESPAKIEKPSAGQKSPLLDIWTKMQEKDARDVELLKRALTDGGDVNSRNPDKSTPLHAAIYVDAPIEVVSTLITRGADVNAQDERGSEPIHLAALRWRKDVTELLLKHGAHFDDEAVVLGSRSTPLGIAVSQLRRNSDSTRRFDAYDVATLLIQHGANVNTIIQQEHAGKETVLAGVVAIAAKEPCATDGTDLNGAREIIALMLSKHCDIDAILPYPWGHGTNVLLDAVCNHDEVTVRLLVERGGANVNQSYQDFDEPNKRKLPTHTLLSRAITSYYYEGEFGVSEQQMHTLELLLRLGANVNAKDSDGATPLHVAVGWRSSGAMKVLLKHGADANAQDSLGQTPLHIAAETTNKRYIAEMLIEHGANVNTLNRIGETPLDSSFGEYTLINELLKHGAVRKSNKR